MMNLRRQHDILLTLQERLSRLTLAQRLQSKDADLAAQAIAAELSGLPATARRTNTHDNGAEFARDLDVTDAIGFAAYFCVPHSPRQRGSIEIANGRLRRDLPRTSTLKEYTDADIHDLIWNLNAKTRKCLGYRTPIEASQPTSVSHLKCEPSTFAGVFRPAKSGLPKVQISPLLFPTVGVSRRDIEPCA